MSILFQKSGILTTVQDLGRTGYRSFGINPGGVMDRTAARLTNIVLGKAENEAVIEMHFPAPRITFEKNTVFALGGADFEGRLDDAVISNWHPVYAKKGSILDFGKRSSGNRCYLAVKGGFEIEHWLDSGSTNLAAGVGGFQGRPIIAGDRIELKGTITKNEAIGQRSIASSLVPRYSPFPTVRITAGAEFEQLTDHSRKLLFEQNFTISNASDRMGFRLSAEPLSLSTPREMLSSAASFGTIQLLPNGQLIILMADHQTSGGYPRIAHVITRDLPLLAQLVANDKAAFHLIDFAQAETLAVEFERELNFLKVGCRLLSK